jgi:hypothetical protein
MKRYEMTKTELKTDLITKLKRDVIDRLKLIETDINLNHFDSLQIELKILNDKIDELILFDSIQI